MIKTITIKSEPVSEEEVEEILPDPLELPIQVESNVTCKREVGSNSNDNQRNCEVKNNNPSVIPDKTLVNLNGVLYLLEKIPDTVVPKSQTQKAVHHTSINSLDDPAPCPHCGKILKRRRNLKLHLQVCSNSITYSCELCPYQTFNEAFLKYHVSACKKKTVSQPLIDLDKDLFLKICSKCNVPMPLETKVCHKCGSLNRWQCKNCNTNFQNYTAVRHHYKTICKPGKFYHCQKCDYRSALHRHVSTHIRRRHPELSSSSTLEYMKKIKAPVGANGIEHICSKCGIKFDEAQKLNRHRYRCKELKSKDQNEKLTGKIENSDSSQTDSSIELTGFKQFIVLHCKTCDKDIELEESSRVAPQKSCTTCSSILTYRCTKCDMLHENYDVISSHVNTICSQPKLIECDDDDTSATCTNCGEYFTNSKLFMWHVENCGVSHLFKCEKCSYTTFNKDYLQRHISSFHGKSDTTNSNSMANRNFAAIYPRIQSFCVNCERRQKTYDRTKFCKICRSKLQFRCTTCNQMYSIDNPDACEHVKAHLKRLRIECQRCGRKFPKIGDKEYQLHVEGCGKVRRYSCELCSYTTKFANHIQKHKQAIHSISNANTMANSKEIRSSQTRKLMAAGMNKDSNVLQRQGSKNEAENSNAIIYKNDSENKLNLQCKVVLTRLKM